VAEKEARATRPIPHAWVLAAIFSTYVITRYPDVGGRINMGDSAKFQFLARTMGIGHAPGNPLYLMASALWVRLPLPLSDATKVTLLSSVAGVVALALVSRATAVLDLPSITLRRFTLEARSFVALLLGLGSLFWTLSTEAEVYTLGSVFVAGAVLGMARWCVKQEANGLFLAVASLGLGLGNHLTIAALAPAMGSSILANREGRAVLKNPRLWGIATAALALGALSYGYIAWRAKNGPLPYSEFPVGPFDWDKLVRFSTARDVMKGTSAPPLSIAAVFERLPDLATQLQKQWSWPLLLFLPFGLLHLFQTQTRFSIFLMIAVAGHFLAAIVFRIPDPEGLFIPVSVLLVIPLAMAPLGLGKAPRVVIAMLTIQGLAAGAHVLTLWRWEFAAYRQQTPEGKVVLNLPTLHEVAPEHAMIAVPCGHYGCVEVINYYKLVDDALLAKDVSFIKFPWSEWDSGKMSLPFIDPGKEKPTQPVCVLLANDVAKLRERGFHVTAIARAPVRIRGRRFESAPLHCILP
jgi:hypothetical protein